MKTATLSHLVAIATAAVALGGSEHGGDAEPPAHALMIRGASNPLDGLAPAVADAFADKNNGTGSLLIDAGGLFGRQTLTCPASAPARCGAGCCGAADKCCTTSCCPIGNAGTCCPLSMGGCCLTTENCVPLRDKCCPKDAQTCGGSYCWAAGATCCDGGASACAAGSTCCGSGCCAAGKQCCGGQGCCDSGETCCPGACCPSGYECSTRYGYCRRKTAPSPTQPTQTTPTASSKSSPQPTIPKLTTPKLPSSEPAPTTPKLTTPKLSTPDASSAAPSTANTAVTSASASPSTSISTTGCRTAAALATATSANLPVMEFRYVGNGIADDIPTNICLGIAHKLNRPSQSIVLTYAGDGRRCTRARGRASGCRGCCSGIRKPVGSPNAGDSTECDEFPFKSTVEGGSFTNGAWTRCVTGWQNQLQGYYLSSWYADHGMKGGDQFVVRVVGLDCAAVKEADLQGCRASGSGSNGGGSGGVVPRDATVLGSGSETSVRRSLDNTTDLVVVAFGDLDGGSFQAVARMAAGRLTRATVLDGDGDEVAAVGSSDVDALNGAAGLQLDFDLDDYVSGIGLLGETTDTTVNLTWQLDVEDDGSATASSTSIAASPSGKSGAGRWEPARGVSWASGLVALGMAALLLC